MERKEGLPGRGDLVGGTESLNHHENAEFYKNNIDVLLPPLKKEDSNNFFPWL